MKTVKLLILGLILSLFVGCGENAQTTNTTTPQGIQLNVTLDNSVQKNNPKRFEKQSDIDKIMLEVKDKNSISIYNKALTKTGTKWSANLNLNPNNAPFTFIATAYDINSRAIYSGTTIISTISTSRDINISIAPIDLKLSVQPFIDSYTKNFTAQGVDFNFTVVNYQKDNLNYMVQPLDINNSICSNPFTPNSGTLTFLTTQTVLSTQWIFDTNSSCQTQRFSVALKSNNNDSVTTIFKLDNNNNFSINLPPDINYIDITEDNSSIDLKVNATDSDGPAPLLYSWALTEGNVSILGQSNLETLQLTGYSGSGRIVLDLNVSDSGGAMSHIGYILHGNTSNSSSQQQKVMFINYSAEHNKSELWGLDTFGKPYMVKVLDNNLTTLTTSSISLLDPNNVNRKYFDSLEIGDTLYFAHNSDELWKSNGESNGTIKIQSFNTSSVYSSIGQFVNREGILYFIAEDINNNVKLWRSDGKQGSAKVVQTTNSNGYSIPYFSFSKLLINIDGTLYFGATNADKGFELWKSNGESNSTKMVKDINLNGDSYPAFLTNYNHSLYFTASSNAPYYFYYNKLWSSNGESNNTIRVNNLSKVSHLTTANGSLYFIDYNSSYNIYELQKYDGNSSTRVTSNSTSFAQLTNVNGLLYFTIDSNNDAIYDELWRYDGNSLSTVKSGLDYIDELTNVNGTLFFPTFGSKYSLWKSSGNSTVKLKDIHASALTNINNTLYFVSNVDELWTSNGESNGTKKIFPTTP